MSLIVPIIGSVTGGIIPTPVEPTVPEYALLSSQYDYAALTTEVTVPHKNILSFNMFCDPLDSSLKYIFKGGTGSSLYYRGSDGRFRLTTDQSGQFTLSIPELFDGKVHKVLIVLLDESMDVFMDDQFYASSVRTNAETFSINEIGNDISVFNFTISNLASYPMLTYDTQSVNVSDEIGSNDLTYVNLLPLTNESYREVSNDY